MNNFLEIKLPDPGERIPQHAMDYGDDQTIGCHVKRRGIDTWRSDDPVLFGVFIGGNRIQTWTRVHEVGQIETFDSIEQMHKRWELD